MTDNPIDLRPIFAALSAKANPWMNQPDDIGPYPEEHEMKTFADPIANAEVQRLRAENERLLTELDRYDGEAWDSLRAKLARVEAEMRAAIGKEDDGGYVEESGAEMAEYVLDLLADVSSLIKEDPKLADAWDEGYRNGYSIGYCDSPTALTIYENPYRTPPCDHGGRTTRRWTDPSDNCPICGKALPL